MHTKAIISVMIEDVLFIIDASIYDFTMPR